MRQPRRLSSSTQWRPGRVEGWSSDGGGLRYYRSGPAWSLAGRVYAAMRGGVAVYEPWSGGAVFHRILDMGSHSYGPLRVNALQVSGGYLVAWSGQTAATIAGGSGLPREMEEWGLAHPAPTLLVYIQPPSARIVAALGARVTSMARIGGEVLVATNTWPNMERRDAGRLDPGTRGFHLARVHELLSQPPPQVVVEARAGMLGERWGGVPLQGYRWPRLQAYTARGARLRVYSYTLGTAPGEAMVDAYTLRPGRDVVELDAYRGLIVSFLLEASPGDRVRLLLE